jgi:hypothetical protein
MWQEETAVLKEKPTPVSLWPPHKSHIACPGTKQGSSVWKHVIWQPELWKPPGLFDITWVGYINNKSNVVFVSLSFVVSVDKERIQ